MNSFNINNNESEENNKAKSKGKSALDLLHKDIIKEDEKNIDLKISDIYGVDFDEANEIHILRIKNLIKKSDILYKMISTIENYFDIPNLSSKVVNGEITENSCVDMLINAVKNQSQSQRKDRYINFYS
jgi:hypothetical protein